MSAPSPFLTEKEEKEKDAAAAHLESIEDKAPPPPPEPSRWNWEADFITLEVNPNETYRTPKAARPRKARKEEKHDDGDVEMTDSAAPRKEIEKEAKKPEIKRKPTSYDFKVSGIMHLCALNALFR